MKITFDFNLSAWVRDLEIEADNLEQAKEKLFDMSISDLIGEGYVSDFEIEDLDYEVEEEETE